MLATDQNITKLLEEHRRTNKKKYKARKQNRNPAYKKRQNIKRVERDRIKHDRQFAIISFDGEGITKEDKHLYTLLLYSDKTGERTGYVQNEQGLSSKECIHFLAEVAEELPKGTIGFSYSFLYDISKIIEDLPDALIYKLMRPQLRHKDDSTTPTPIRWANGKHHYTLNFFNGKFTVKFTKSKKQLVIWDVIKFFQGSFVDSIEKWKVGTQEQRDIVRQMKEKRSDFTEEMTGEVWKYCHLECMLNSELVEKLLNAHRAADLRLTQFYGAGSTGSALLNKFDTKGLINKEIPYASEEMADAVTRAFFGGRFENSICGLVTEPVNSYDISSAYPYQITFLPCLEHGRWKEITNRKELDKYKHALVKWAGPEIITQLYWGGLPFRREDGAIIFPATGGIGFTYLQEFLQAEKLFGHKFVKAWVLEQDCDCQPFKEIPHYYLERIKLGKDGPGIVLKLALNSMYGKMAQSLGDDPPYRSWIWASMVTSGCRAQMLELMGKHHDLSNLLAIATDGGYSLEEIDCPLPINTGTDVSGKPLGGWEHKSIDIDNYCEREGIFFARSGINFRLNSSNADLIRSRGISRKVVVTNRDLILDCFNEDKEKVEFPDVTRFWGCKSSVYSVERNPPKGKEHVSVLPVYKRTERYGRWVDTKYQLSFNPQPKRAGRIGNRLTTWRIGPNEISKKYSKADIDEMEYDESADSEQSW